MFFQLLSYLEVCNKLAIVTVLRWNQGVVQLGENRVGESGERCLHRRGLVGESGGPDPGLTEFIIYALVQPLKHLNVP